MQQQCHAEILHYSHFQLLQKLLQSYPTSTEIKFHKMIFGSPMSSNGDPVISKIRTSLQEKYNWLFNAVKGGHPQFEQPYGLKNTRHSERKIQ